MNSQTAVLFGLSVVAFITWIDELILREWICELWRFGDVSVWLWFFPAGTMKKLSFSVLLSPSLSASPQMSSELNFSHVLQRDDRKSPKLYWVGGGEFLWNGCVRGACFPTSLQGIPLSSLCCKPASPHRWWTSLFGRCSYTWRLQLPTAMRLSGQNASKSAGEHYISHYLRTIGHFLLAAGQRGWVGAAKLQEESMGLRRGWRLKGKLYEVDELLGRWFQSGCEVTNLPVSVNKNSHGRYFRFEQNHLSKTLQPVGFFFLF